MRRLSHTLGRGSFLARDWVERYGVHAQINGPSSGVDDNESLRSIAPRLLREACNAIVKARLAFRYQMDTRSPFGCGGNEPSTLDRVTILLLLQTFPAIRMSENEFGGVFDGRPIESYVVLLDICLGAVEEILDEICQDVDSRFSGWKWGQLSVFDVGGR